MRAQIALVRWVMRFDYMGRYEDKNTNCTGIEMGLLNCSTVLYSTHNILIVLYFRPHLQICFGNTIISGPNVPCMTHFDGRLVFGEEFRVPPPGLQFEDRVCSTTVEKWLFPTARPVLIMVSRLYQIYRTSTDSRGRLYTDSSCVVECTIELFKSHVTVTFHLTPQPLCSLLQQHNS